MRIMLFGKNGQVGWELRRTLAPLGEVDAVDYPEVDFLDLAALRVFTLKAQPDLIVNAAAYTAVDQAESEPEVAMRVNGEAPGVLAEIARERGIGLVHFSTDYVFDGMKGEPYTEDDEPNPINVYGHTKLTGDRAIQESGCTHLILRTSWVYGTRGSNFFLTMLRLAREREEISVVNDQIGSPTWSRAIAEATAQILRCIREETGSTSVFSLGEAGGLYNTCSGGEASWLEFARAILEREQKENSQRSPKLVPISSKEYQSQAMRPGYSVLDTMKAERRFEIKIHTWQEQLESCWQSKDPIQ